VQLPRSVLLPLNLGLLVWSSLLDLLALCFRFRRIFRASTYIGLNRGYRILNSGSCCCDLHITSFILNSDNGVVVERTTLPFHSYCKGGIAGKRCLAVSREGSIGEDEIDVKCFGFESYLSQLLLFLTFLNFLYVPSRFSLKRWARSLFISSWKSLVDINCMPVRQWID
jgi:hypothetical protein